jgi:hypothetical protein
MGEIPGHELIKLTRRYSREMKLFICSSQHVDMDESLKCVFLNKPIGQREIKNIFL